MNNSRYVLRLILVFFLSLPGFLAFSQNFAPAGSTPEINSFTLYNGDIYAGGGNSYGKLVKWNGATWDSVDLGMPLNSYTAAWPAISALVEYDGFLYLGGLFNDGSVNSYERNIRRWDGTTWSALGVGIGDVGISSNSSVLALAVYNGELYVAGKFDKAGGVSESSIAKWNGTSWSSVAGGLGYKVTSLVVHKGALYAGGEFGPNQPIRNIAKWDGTTWTALGAGTNNPVFALAVHNGELYAAGCFDSAGTVAANHVAKWDGTSWSALGSGFTGPPAMRVVSLVSYGGVLYASGTFTTADGLPAISYLAKWDGTSWSSAGAGTNGVVRASLHHNSELFLGGTFTMAGGLPAANITRLVSCTTSPVQPSSISGNNAPCMNTSGVYSVPPEIGEVYSYNWTLPTGWSGSGTGNSIAVTAGSTGGNITVTPTNGCGTGTPQTLAVNPLPVTPITITQAGNVFTAPQGLVSYQWYSDTGLIVGATMQSYTANQDGSYFVIGVEANGCPTQSNTISILLGIGSTTSLAGIQLYPNPNAGIFTIIGATLSANETVGFEVRDITARLINSGSFTSKDHSFTKQIVLDHVSPGLYILKLNAESGSNTYPFVVN